MPVEAALYTPRGIVKCEHCPRWGHFGTGVCGKCFSTITDDPIAHSQTMHDPVNHPKHYNTGKIEVIDFIEDKHLGFHEGNVIKYVARAKHKGSELEDLKKARWYLERAIKNIEHQQLTDTKETPK